MLSRRALGAARPLLRPFRPANVPKSRRTQSSNSSAPNNNNGPQNNSEGSRASRILDRLPTRMQKYTSSLRKAPLSHVVAFLLLHEITAIVPVLGLFALFHYTSWTPLEYVSGHWATYVRDGAAKAERYFSRKGWFGFGQDDRGRIVADLNAGPHAGATQEVENKWAHESGPVTGSVAYTTTRATPEAAGETEDVLRRWMGQDAKYKVVVEVALAWAVTKALLPARIMLSVWGTPWFAGVMVRTRNAFRR